MMEMMKLSDFDATIKGGRDPSLPPSLEERDTPFILIADDDEHICRLLTESLRGKGTYRIQSVNNGRLALEVCEKETPDLILVDAKMPEMSGFEFIETFRQRPEAAAIPILMLSGFGDLCDRIHGLRLGAVDYLSKPFHPMEVVLRVRRHLESRQLYKKLDRQREHINEQAGALEAILHAVPSGLAVLDGNLQVILHNPQFARLFPQSNGSIDGSDISTLCRLEVHRNGQNSDGWRCPLKDDLLRTLNKGEAFHLQEIVFPSEEDDQKSRYLIFMATRFSNRTDRLLLDIRDFSSQKEVERASAHRDRLAMLGDLSVGVAHEINNPNAFVRLNAGNIKTLLHSLGPVFEEIHRVNPDVVTGPLSKEEIWQNLEEAVEGIMKATERITAVVDRLKTFSRAEKPHIEEVTLSKVVQNALTMAAFQLKQIEEIRFQDKNQSLPPVLGSQLEYEQVVINLLTNACQAIDEKRKNSTNGNFKGRLSVWYERNENFIDFFVSDNGIGMTESAAANIFTPYYTTKERGQGTGLGLSISHGIITKYNGKIEVESTPNQGTIFKVSLPIAAHAEAAVI